MQLETYVNGELMSSGFVSAGGRKAADDAEDANNGLGAELGVRSGGIGSGGQLLQGLGAGNREVKVVATEKAWYTPMRRFIPKVFGALRTADITLSTPLVPVTTRRRTLHWTRRSRRRRGGRRRPRP